MMMMIMTVSVIIMMMLRFPGHTALHTRDRHGADLKWSYEDYMEDVRTAAKGFIALGLERLNFHSHWSCDLNPASDWLIVT